MNTTLIVVPEGGSAMDVLAERYHAATKKMEGGRAQWIAGTLERAVVVLDVRIDYPDHRAFSQWLNRHGFQKVGKNDLTALLWMAENLEVARTLLEQTKSMSLETIYRSRSNHQSGTLPNFRKGTVSARGHLSGSGQRKRKREPRIPDVMREDNPPPAPTPRRRVSDMGLTPEQVDPDFNGTPLQFITKYGHVNLQTKAQIDHHKQQDILNTWLGTVSELERNGRAMLEALAAVDHAALCAWMAKPGKTEKLQAWYDGIQRACDGLRNIITETNNK